MTTLFGLVELVGIFGNLLVIIAIARERRLKSNYYLLVMVLATCDLTLLLCSSHDNIIRLWIPSMTFTTNTVVCMVWVPLQLCTYFVECHLLCFIGVLRHRVVCRPIEPALPRRKVKFYVFLILILSPILFLPNVFARRVHNGTCSGQWDDNILYQIHRLTLTGYSSLVPPVLLAILYVKIFRELVRHHREINTFSTTPNNGNEHSTARQARNIRVSIVNIIIVVVFVISSVPSTVGWLVLTYTKSTEYSVMQWLWLIYYGGVTAVNPVIYGLRDRSLFIGCKRSFNKFFAWLKTLRSPHIADYYRPSNSSNNH